MVSKALLRHKNDVFGGLCSLAYRISIQCVLIKFIFPRKQRQSPAIGGGLDCESDAARYSRANVSSVVGRARCLARNDVESSERQL
jgi:hypothetical protein